MNVTNVMNVLNKIGAREADVARAQFFRKHESK